MREGKYWHSFPFKKSPKRFLEVGREELVGNPSWGMIA